MMKFDAQKYRQTDQRFTPVYQQIADQILSATGKTSGVCVDLGCGPGGLGKALLDKSDLFVHFFDQSVEMLEQVDEKMSAAGTHWRSSIICGDIACIDLADASVDLAVSRGSIFFWEDLEAAFREIERILASGGWGYIGGGFGSRQLKEEITSQMNADPDNIKGDFRNKIKRNLGPESRERFEKALQRSGIGNYSIVQNEDIGLWIQIRK